MGREEPLLNRASLYGDIVAYSPDGDPLALVEISKEEAARLVSLPEAMGPVFRATVQPGGQVYVEVVALYVAGCLLSD